MNYLPLLGIALVVIGFALRFNPLLVVAVAGVVTGLLGGMPADVAVLEQTRCQPDSERHREHQYVRQQALRERVARSRLLVRVIPHGARPSTSRARVKLSYFWTTRPTPL